MNGIVDVFHASPHFILAQAGLPHGRFGWLGETLGGIGGLLYLAFWVWMLVHCIQTEPDRNYWVWIMIVFQGIGPILYFVTRYLPTVDVHGPQIFRRWTRGRELERLETAAVQIGNAHQYTKWADALREVGRIDEAADAYKRALDKDPRDLQALWGATRVAAAQKRFSDSRDLSRQILEKDPQYKFGDVSLELAKSLAELGEVPAAIEQLDNHIRRWRHPEALYLLAKLRFDTGDYATSRDHLQSVLRDISGSPSAIARKHGRWKSRARQLLKQIPKN